MELKRKYAFSWDLLGNIELGRPNLGHNTRLEVYRLMLFCFRDVMEQRMGVEKTDQVFYDSGKLAGAQFYKHFLADAQTFDEFLRKFQDSLKEMGIGILRMEKSDADRASFVMTISEDLDCSGLPDLDFEVCKYDEGFLAGVLESFTGKDFKVKEVDCWCTGERTCRFAAERVNK